MTLDELNAIYSSWACVPMVDIFFISRFMHSCVPLKLCDGASIVGDDSGLGKCRLAHFRIEERSFFNLFSCSTAVDEITGGK